MRLLITITACALCGSAAAQDEPERDERGAALEPTMILLPAAAENPAALTATLELPGDTSNDATLHARGARRGERGLDTASAARENGRAFGQAAAAAARDNREKASRASRNLGPVVPSPEPPNRPSPPGR